MIWHGAFVLVNRREMRFFSALEAWYCSVTDLVYLTPLKRSLESNINQALASTLFHIEQRAIWDD